MHRKKVLIVITINRKTCRYPAENTLHDRIFIDLSRRMHFCSQDGHVLVKGNYKYDSTFTDFIAAIMAKTVLYF